MSEAFEQLRQELTACATVEGVTSLYIMSLPDGARKIINKMIRKGALTAADLAPDLGLTAAETEQVLDILEDKGFVASQTRAQDNARVYRVRLARTRELGGAPPASST